MRDSPFHGSFNSVEGLAGIRGGSFLIAAARREHLDSAAYPENLNGT
jgi:hypothetical protein